MKYKHECSKYVTVNKQRALRVLADEDRARGVPTTPQQPQQEEEEEESEEGEEEDVEMQDD